MTKPDILSIGLLAMLLAPLAGCQTPPRQGEVQEAQDHQVQARHNEAKVREREVQPSHVEVKARDRDVKVRDREAQARQDEAKVRDRHDEAGGFFSGEDIAYIRDYYKQGPQLGITVGRIMKLRQGEPYPFGYTWRALPRDLEIRLSHLPPGYIRIIVGTDIGILEIRTRVVVDLLENPAA